MGKKINYACGFALLIIILFFSPDFPIPVSKENIAEATRQIVIVIIAFIILFSEVLRK
jgi:hypothetical protein